MAETSKTSGDSSAVENLTISRWQYSLMIGKTRALCIAGIIAAGFLLNVGLTSKTLQLLLFLLVLVVVLTYYYKTVLSIIETNKVEGDMNQYLRRIHVTWVRALLPVVALILLLFFVVASGLHGMPKDTL